jgi:hypothetical protein
LPEEDVEVPEWGGTVKVRAITGAEMARAKRAATKKPANEIDEIQFNALLVVAGCVEPSFPPASEQRLMREQAAGPVARIASRIMDLSGFGGEEAEPGEA